MINDLTNHPDPPKQGLSQNSPTVRVIPASNTLHTGSSKSVERIDNYLPPTGFFRSGTEKKPLRIAAYCRVSTELDSQKSSYELQLQYYTEFISRHSNWKLVKIYADEGISGTSIRKRAAFQEMIADAKAGNIDYIITKSLSRFARNTVDSLNAVRTLQFLKPPVGIYFEKENIDTLDSKSELLITLLSALAQDESRSISENQKWAFQRRFQRGEGFFTRILGYEKGPDGQWKIHEEEAQIVEFIFAKYLAGWGTKTIADALTRAGVKTSRNHSTWYANSILRILRNEKYAGDMLLQKTVKADLFSHYSIKNDGREPSYYVREHHPAIIGRATWEAVQEEINRRADGLNLHGGAKSAGKAAGNTAGKAARKVSSDSKNCFKGVLRCKNCGKLMVLRRKQITVEKNVKRFWVYQCPSGCFEKNEDSPFQNSTAQAPPPKLTQAALEQAFMNILYDIRSDYLRNGIAADGIRNLYSSDGSLETVGNEPAEKGVKLLKLLRELPEPERPPHRFGAQPQESRTEPSHRFGPQPLLPFRYDLFSELVGDAYVSLEICSEGGHYWQLCFHTVYGGELQGIIDGKPQDIINGNPQDIMGETVQEPVDGRSQDITNGNPQDIMGETLQEEPMHGRPQDIIGEKPQDIMGETLQEPVDGNPQDIMGKKSQDPIK